MRHTHQTLATVIVAVGGGAGAGYPPIQVYICVIHMQLGMNFHRANTFGHLLFILSSINISGDHIDYQSSENALQRFLNL